MDYMELQFPEDAREERVRKGRNISDAERWISMAAGGRPGRATGSARRRPAAGCSPGSGRCSFRRGMTGHCHTYELLGLNTAGTGEDTRQALGGIGRRDRRRERHDQPADLGALSLLAEPREPAALHVASRVGRTRSPTRSRAGAPRARRAPTVEWNAEIINEVPDQVIGWRSIEGSDVVSAGSVNFDEAGRRRTRVRVRLQYSPPGGKVGAAVARLMGSRCRDRDPRGPAPVQAARRKPGYEVRRRTGSCRFWTRAVASR